ncbi:RING-H2 zinc finger protein RHA1a-like [Panicum miliaceum]|uniref:RING-H2 zinc finger protein RHA1a-like n=1 Tax=Panicum miliaceum TaxID=4540 RepID=A0A3L6QGX4_PANMI|nr:RING-H2 zinc finger protein RHA1a-like [Panicum miliaceum]
MGFPLVSYCLAVPKPVIVFCKVLSVIRDAFLLMLAVLGLCPFPYDDVSRGPADGPKPEEVKSRLPALEYGELVAERLVVASPGGGGHPACRGEEAASPTCIVCLERVEADDEVRRLGNCAHAFHRGCIDRWIDLGRATCPLCRSDLLPRPRGRARLGRLASLLTRVW